MDDMATRRYRERLLNDPYRPGYHLVVPDGKAIPGDPNGYFFANGRHHLMYLYRHDASSFHWGHVSSVDLLHWRHHEDALCAGPCDHGCYSGGAFVDDDGKAYLSYWIYSETSAEDEQGIGLAVSEPPYDTWYRLPKAIISSSRWGIRLLPDGTPLGCADPSNIWKKGGTYYLQTGNKLVLDEYGRRADSPVSLRGDWTELFKSTDLRHWTYCGRFYARRGDNAWTEESEDDMCPSFLPLPARAEGGRPTDTYLQLFISHNRGCQYYLGALEGERFLPAAHGRMSWVDDTLFAPEAAMDGNGRQIMFAWLRDDLSEQYETYGWAGVYGLPRTLWLRPDGRLGIAPVKELERLRVRALCVETPVLCPEGSAVELEAPQSCELRVCFGSLRAACGLSVLLGADGTHVDIGYDPESQRLYVDATASGSASRACREEAPLALEADEPLTLTVYLDKSVVEVFANEAQAITRRVYPGAPVLPSVVLWGDGRIDAFQAWELAPSMPY